MFSRVCVWKILESTYHYRKNDNSSNKTEGPMGRTRNRSQTKNFSEGNFLATKKPNFENELFKQARPVLKMKTVNCNRKLYRYEK